MTSLSSSSSLAAPPLPSIDPLTSDGSHSGLGSSMQYVHSCDVSQNVRIKLCTLEGALPLQSLDELLENPLLKYCGRRFPNPDLLVEATITDGSGTPLHVPVFTAYKPFQNRWEWNEWLQLPIKFRDLPRDAALCLDIFDCVMTSDPARFDEDRQLVVPEQRNIVGGTTVSLFGRKSATFRSGPMDLRVWNGKHADGSKHTATSGKPTNEDMENLQRLSKRHLAENKPENLWLDRLSLSEVNKENQKEKTATKLLFLTIEFPTFGDRERGAFKMVYFEPNGMEANEVHIKSEVIRIPDFEIDRENLVEAKHHRLARSQRAGQIDKDLKPNAETRNRLNEIIHYPSSVSLSSEEQDLIWRFRYYLCNDKRAISKFVKCINWKVRLEAGQALELIHKRWAPMDVADALELLGPSFRHPGLRSYAVMRLRQAKDDDLQLYLLQLVQALKYERISEAWLYPTTAALALAAAEGGDQPAFGLQESAEGLHSDDDSSLPPGAMHVEQSLTESDLRSQMSLSTPEMAGDDGGLAGFLIDRACGNSSIANYLYWYLTVEAEDAEDGSVREDDKYKEMYGAVLKRFKDTLRRGGPPEWRQQYAEFQQQTAFLSKLFQLIKSVERESGNRNRKIEKLQELLANPDAFKFNFSRFEPMRLPLDPDVTVCGIEPGSALLFKSSLMPARLTFVTTDGEPYVTLFKHGDDLRQDQLVLQIITLMDRILQQENLDLKLTPYKVLATSSSHGFVQFVDSQPIASILKTDKSIHNYFRKHRPCETGPYGIEPAVMDTYVKSCAGYCVITYLLGVGDRHLDNLLLTKDGHLFHIDFGYILGRDPKVLPPPMKLSKEMLEGFGGPESEHFGKFKQECYTAYLSLRRCANLFVNLFGLMVDASVPDIALEPDKTVNKVLEKFRLDLNEEQALQYIQAAIEVSANAVMAAFVEKVHEWAQFFRS